MDPAPDGRPDGATRSPAVVVPTVLAVLFALANAVVHLREWLQTYLELPDQIPGVWVVKIGFPVQIVLAVVLAGALVFALWRRPRLLWPVAVANVLFELGSIGALLVSRYASLFGWTERTWSGGPTQALVVEIAAALAAVGVIVTSRSALRPPA